MQKQREHSVGLMLKEVRSDATNFIENLDDWLMLVCEHLLSLLFGFFHLLSTLPTLSCQLIYLNDRKTVEKCSGESTA